MLPASKSYTEEKFLTTAGFCYLGGGSHLKVVSDLTNVFLLSQVRFLRYIHAGNVSEDFVSRIHFSYIRLPEGCMELARFYCRCSRVGNILSNQSTH